MAPTSSPPDLASELDQPQRNVRSSENALGFGLTDSGRSVGKLPPLERPPHEKGPKGPVTAQAVDKLVAAGIVEIAKSIDTLGQPAKTTSDANFKPLTQEKKDVVLTEIINLLESQGMRKTANELSALKKEIVGFERTITDLVSKPLTIPLRSEISDLRAQQNKAEAMMKTKNEVVAKSEKACASLKQQTQELEKQIRNWNKREADRQGIPKRLEEAQEAARKEAALAGKSEAWLAYEKNEKKSKTLANNVKRDRAEIIELTEEIFQQNGHRLKAIASLKAFMEQGCKERLKKVTADAQRFREKLYVQLQARERAAMNCEDCRVRYFSLEEQGRETLKTSLVRLAEIRELQPQQKEVHEALRVRRTEVAARKCEVAYEGWWLRQLKIERQNMQQKIRDTSSDTVLGNIKKLHDDAKTVIGETEAVLREAKTTMIKHEVCFHKKSNEAIRMLALQRRQHFETKWQEIQVAEREVELENLVAGDMEVVVAKEARVAALKRKLATLVNEGDTQQEHLSLQMQLKELSEHTFRVESHMTLLERAERMIAAPP